MLPLAHITQWRTAAPWASTDDVEQDLILSRALVEIYRDDFLRGRLAFRGGTALHKLHLAPAARYSEDLDFVQRQEEGIGPVFDRLREILDWIDEHPKTERGERMVNIVFRFTTAGGSAARVKVEINRREHFSAPNVLDRPYAMNSLFFSGEASIVTYSVDELLATKLRALYQRKRGRDLFDLWWAKEHVPIDLDDVMRLFEWYWCADGAALLTERDLRAHLEAKRQENVFQDVMPFLAAGVNYDWHVAYDWFVSTILPRLP